MVGLGRVRAEKWLRLGCRQAGAPKDGMDGIDGMDPAALKPSPHFFQRYVCVCVKFLTCCFTVFALRLHCVYIVLQLFNRFVQLLYNFILLFTVVLICLQLCQVLLHVSCMFSMC